MEVETFISSGHVLLQIATGFCQEVRQTASFATPGYPGAELGAAANLQGEKAIDENHQARGAGCHHRDCTFHSDSECASWADDGAGLYKAKCAACHGADGAGKPEPRSQA